MNNKLLENDILITIIEDNPQDLELIIRNLNGVNKNWRFLKCHNEEGLKTILLKESPDLIISDYNLPSFSCEKAIEISRAHISDIPFIVVSGFIGELQAIKLIVETKVNDCVSKDNLNRLVPSVLRELESFRVRKNLRKTEKEQDRSLQLLRAINDITTSLLDVDSIAEISSIISDKLMAHFDFEDCVIYKLDKNSSTLTQVAATGSKKSNDSKKNNALTLKLGEGIVGYVANSKKAEIVNDLTKDDRYIKDIKLNKSEIAVPILLDGELLGVIDSEHNKKDFYTELHLQNLQTVAGVIATKFKAGQEREQTKSASLQLEKNELLLRQITNNIDAAVFRYTIKKSDENVFTYLSSKTYDIYEITPREGLRNDNLIWDQVFDEDKSTVDKTYQEAIKNTGSYVLEFRIKTPSGKIKWIESNGTITYAENGDIISDIINRDITENKKIELELIESEEKLKAITDNIEGLVQRFELYENGSSAVTFISKGVEEIHGLTQEQVLNETLLLWGQIHEDDLEAVQKSIEKSAQEMSLWDQHWRINHPDGKIKWLRGTGVPKKDTESNTILWDTVVLDVTTKKLSKQKLIEANDRLLEAQELAKIGDWSIDLVTQETYLSPTTKKIYEVEENLPIDAGISYYKEGYNRKKIAEVLNEAIENGTPFLEELVLVTAKGNERWVRAQGKATFKNGKCVRINGTIMDITEQYNLQKELKDKEQRLSAAVEGADLGVWEFDFEANTNFVNDKYLEILGYTKSDVNFTLEWFKSLVHPDDLYLVNQEFARITAGDENEIDITIRMKANDGSYKILKDKGRIVEFGENRSIKRIVGTILDVTETVELQNAIQQSLDEKVVLLSEIHHRVKNNLAIITGLIDLQSMDSEDETLKNLLGDTALRIKSIANVHELLYNSESFSDISFDKYIRNLLDSIQKTINNKTGTINIDIDANLTVNINQAIPMGLLLNELITNSFKYAFNSDEKNNQIYFSLSYRDGYYHGTYSDSGDGFDMQKFNKTSSLGALLIHTLLEQLNSEFNIETKNGFTVIFKFPPLVLGTYGSI